MDDAIVISNLNDFIFCPASIYFHNLYGGMNTMSYQAAAQINGTAAHKAVDNGKYSTRKNVLTAIDVYSSKYNIVGKIDIFDCDKGILTERKRQIKQIYDGYVFQIYAQYFALCEMGYNVQYIRLYSMIDNRVYPIDMPDKNPNMFAKFEQIIFDMKNFDLNTFQQSNKDKCRNCIYEPACDRGLV